MSDTPQRFFMWPDLIRAVIAKRFLIVVVTVVAFVVSVAGVLMRGANYSAETILTINSFDGSEGVAELVPDSLNPRAYQELVSSVTVFGKTRDRLVESGAWENEPPALAEFMRHLSAKTTVVDQTTRPVSYAPFLILNAKNESPDTARTIVSVWAEVATEAVNGFNRRRYALTIQSLARQENKQKNALAGIRAQLAKDEADWNLDVLQNELNGRVDLIGSVKDQLIAAKRERAAAEQRLASAESELADTSETVNLFRAPSDDVFWLKQKAGAEPSSKIPTSGMRTEVVNSVYTRLKTDQTAAQQELAATTAEIETLVAETTALEMEKDDLQRALAEHRAFQKELEVVVNSMQAAYAQIAHLELLTSALGTLVEPGEENGAFAIGLNRFDETVYVREDSGITGRKGRVVLGTLVGFLGVVAYAVLVYILPAYWAFLVPESSVSRDADA